jgi:hypothetical protein
MLREIGFVLLALRHSLRHDRTKMPERLQPPVFLRAALHPPEQAAQTPSA